MPDKIMNYPLSDRGREDWDRIFESNTQENTPPKTNGDDDSEGELNGTGTD